MPKFNFGDLIEKEEKEEKKERIIIREKKEIKHIEKSEISNDFSIDEIMSDLSKTSEFKRLIYKALMGKVHRGSSLDLDKQLSESILKFRNL